MTLPVGWIETLLMRIRWCCRVQRSRMDPLFRGGRLCRGPGQDWAKLDMSRTYKVRANFFFQERCLLSWCGDQG